jgi:hypothetical protein
MSRRWTRSLRSTIRPHGLWILGTILVVSLYGGLAARHLTMPGIQGDEIAHAAPAITLLRAQANPEFKPMVTLNIGGRIFPFMHLSYLGSLKSYVLALSFFFFGESMAVMRLTMIFITAIGLFFFSAFIKETFGGATALVAGLLVATDPSLILYSRNDWGPIAIAFTCRALALFFLMRWWKSGGKLTPLIAACVFLGLGIYDKANFVWFVTAIVVGGSVVWLFSEKRPSVTLKQTAMAIVTGLLASAPLWVLNIYCRWPTFQTISDYRKDPLTELLKRISMLRDVFSGRATDVWMFGQHISGHFGVTGTLLWPLSWIAVMALCCHALVRAKHRGALLALLTLNAVILIQILLTPLAIGPHHWIFLYPFPHLTVALTCTVLSLERQRHPWQEFASKAGLALAAVAVIFNLFTVSEYHKLMKNTGGYQGWSSVIDPLCGILQVQYANRTIQCHDWGLAGPLHFLSKGKLNLHESYYGQLDTSEPTPKLIRLVQDPYQVFLLRSPLTTVYHPARTAFFKAIEQTKITIKSRRDFVDQRGRQVYSIIELAKP